MDFYQILSSEPNEKGRAYGRLYLHTWKPTTWSGVPIEFFTDKENMEILESLTIDSAWLQDQKTKQIQSERELAHIVLNC